MLELKGIGFDNVRIFRISTEKLHKGIQFYHDTMYREKNYVYAFVKFPWDVMEEVDFFPIL